MLLAAHGVPAWLLAIGFGRAEHLAADEPHADWTGRKGSVATTVGGGIWGVALTVAADDAHLREAYGIFAAEARDVEPADAPATVNTDGWAATRNALRSLFPTIAVVLCFLHGFLKVRDRCRKARDRHRRVWSVSRAATAAEYRRLMSELRQGCTTRAWTVPVREMLEELWGKTEAYAMAYDHPGCHRTSNAVDRPMNRLCRLRDAGRGLHGHQGVVRVAAARLGAAAELPARRAAW